MLAELVVHVAFLGLAEDTPLNPSCRLSFRLENVSFVTGYLTYLFALHLHS